MLPHAGNARVDGRGRGVGAEAHGRARADGNDMSRRGHGKRRYTYDGFGQLVEAIAADESVVTFDYDGLGRLLLRHDADGDTVHTYDTTRVVS